MARRPSRRRKVSPADADWCTTCLAGQATNAGHVRVVKVPSPLEHDARGIQQLLQQRPTDRVPYLATAQYSSAVAIAATTWKRESTAHKNNKASGGVQTWRWYVGRSRVRNRRRRVATNESENTKSGVQSQERGAGDRGRVSRRRRRNEWIIGKQREWRSNSRTGDARRAQGNK